MKTLKFVMPAFILAGGILISTPSYGTVAMAKKEGTNGKALACTVCHTAAGKKDLNAVGKCYKANPNYGACKDAK